MKLRQVAVTVMMSGVAVTASAQDPVRLPGIRITADVEPPGPNRIAGVVRDTFSLAIDGVEITLPLLQKRAVSDSAGKFRLEGVRPGTYEVRARKIGYAPQIKTVEVDKSGGIAAFELLPRMATLPVAISTASRGGLSGTVGDTGYRAIAHARIRILGKADRGETDSLGHFFFPVAAGRYVVAIQQDGFQEKIVSVTVPPDSGRHMTVLLPPHQRTVREAWNIPDFDRRLALRTNVGSWVFTHDELEKFGFDWASDAIARGLGMAGASNSLSPGCHATVNGGPGAVEIAKLTIDDVETVEIYADRSNAQRITERPGRINNIGGPKGIADSRAATRLPLTNTEVASFYNQGIRPPCPIVYIWMR
jgi:hypothetical protein